MPDTTPMGAELPLVWPTTVVGYDFHGDEIYAYSFDDLRNYALAAIAADRLSASRAVPEGLSIGFSPMWLAPIDGTPVLLHMPTCGTKFSVGQFHSEGPDTIRGYWGDDEGNFYVHEPVGWMGLHVLERIAAATPAGALTVLQPSVAVRESDQQLMRFYSVETLSELIDAQERHIVKLQAKLPPLRDELPRNPRIG